MDKNRVQEWSSKRLQENITKSITKMFEGMLDFSEVAVGDETRYKALRSKILRLANDAIRNINAEIENKYEVVFTGINEDVVVKVNTGRKGEVR
jgi:hypothetical protein